MWVRAVCDIRPQKYETHRVHLTVGGNLITYPIYVSITIKDLTTLNMNCNIITPNPSVRYMYIYIY